MSNTLLNADLGRALKAAATELDRDIAASGAAGRVSAAVLARIVTRPIRRIPWFAVAAALILAAGLGSVTELAMIQGAEEQAQNVVLLDPMVFGPNEVDAQ